MPFALVACDGLVSGAAHDACVRSEVAIRYPRCKPNPLMVCDACAVPPALGAVLLQHDHPVSYYSRKFPDPEANYSASDWEMLAVVCALREWRCYLEGAKFTIVTDHQPNTYLDVSSSAHTLKRRARWLDVACGYDYTWCSRPGRLNVADPLSRAPQHALQHQPSVALALQLVRHAASETPLPSPSCCALCALKTSRLTRQSVAQDAGQPSLTRGASGLHISDGGVDTPSSDRSNEIAAEQQADASYPAGSADDEIAASSFALQSFVQRFKRGYEHDRSVSPSQFDYPSLRQDSNGLCWTAEDKLAVPSFDKLREEVFESPYMCTRFRDTGA